MDEQRNQFVEMESSPGEDVKIGEVTTKDLEYYLVDKAVAWFEKTDSNSERSYAEGKMLSALHATEKSFTKEETINMVYFIVVVF